MRVGVVVALLVFVKCVVGKKYTVGEGLCDPPTWSSYSCDYNTWALQYDFAIGDSLVFNFDAGEINVAEVSKDDYDACSGGTVSQNPKYVYSRPPVTITLSKTGTFYFVSTAGLLGCIYQNLALTVNGTSTTPDSSSSASSSLSPPSSSSSSSISLSPPSSSSSSSSSLPSQGSSHKSIIGPVVGSIGSIVVVVKVALISYCLHRRRQQRINGQQPPPKHQAAPGLYHHHASTAVPSHQVVVDVNIDQETGDIAHGIPASSYN